MVALKRISVTFTSIACLVVINITSVHKSLMMSNRDTIYRTSIASVICKLGDSCVLLSNVVTYLFVYIYIYIFPPIYINQIIALQKLQHVGG
jgi:hypothetical protein